MKKKILLLSLLFIGFFQINVSAAKEPKNLDLIKSDLIKYHDSGEYRKDQAKVIGKAMQYLKTRIAQAKEEGSQKKLAIVLDIDETALSNYPSMLEYSFGGTPDQVDANEGKGDDPAIEPTLKLYRYAKANQVAVFFITGRHDDIRTNTERNLKAAGYTQWDGLIFKPYHYKEKTAGIYKALMRKQIEANGYDIVLNIGDQRSDLSGGYADKHFKLPNPYYIVP